MYDGWKKIEERKKEEATERKYNDRLHRAAIIRLIGRLIEEIIAPMAASGGCRVGRIAAGAQLSTFDGSHLGSRPRPKESQRYRLNLLWSLYLYRTVQ